MKITLIILIIGIQSSDIFSQHSKEIELRSHISKILSDHHIPGAGIALVAKDSIIWTGVLGKSDVSNNTPVTENTLFAIGSIAKTFLSTAAMIAQKQGAIR